MQNGAKWPLNFDGERVVLDAVIETRGNSATPGQHFLSAILHGQFVVRSEPVPEAGMTYPLLVEGRLMHIVVAPAKGHLLSLRIDS